MVILKCKMCGGDIQVTGQTYGICDSCGNTMTLPKIDENKKANLFNRANHFRLQGEYDKAIQAYENILNEDIKDSEAYWGCVLSQYGIEYVKDPSTNKMIPTSNRVQVKSILSDVNYLAALEHAQDSYSRSLYEGQAKIINQIQKSILAISNKEEPYDIFICYKETSSSGTRTEDSVFAQDIYYGLIKEGYKVFFSKISLEDKLGHQYEPYIYAALNSAKIMLVITSKVEYINSIWVKNEWSRYLKMKEEDMSRLIIPCFVKMNPYDLPEELSIFQSLDMSKIGFMQDLIHSIKKILTPISSTEQSKLDGTKAKVQTTQTEPLGATADSLYQRAVMFLEDGDFASSNIYFNKVLDIMPEYAPAHMGIACCHFEVRYVSSLNDIDVSLLFFNSDIKRALHFADKEYKDELLELENKIKEWEEVLRIINEKNDARRDILDVVEIFGGEKHAIALRKDGTVASKGANSSNQCEVYEWTDIVKIAVGGNHTLGLKKGGTVVATGDNTWGQNNISGWTDIVEITAGEWHSVGIKNDGTAIATGDNAHGQCNVEKWENIVSIYARKNNTVGIKKDGRVVAIGDNTWGQNNVSEWRNIESISIGDRHIVGIMKDNKELVVDNKDSDIEKLKGLNKILAAFKGRNDAIVPERNGNVVAVGCNSNGQCNVEEWDVVKVVAGDRITVGLNKDGFVGSTGYDIEGISMSEWWVGIIDIGLGEATYGSEMLIVGLRQNGTVSAVGSNRWGECNVKDWKNIEAIAVGDRYIMGLKKDGRVITKGLITVPI